jgi:hypothetical protein
LTLQLDAQQSHETSQTTHLIAWRHIPEVLNPQQHSHKNLKSCKVQHIWPQCLVLGALFYWQDKRTSELFCG